MTIIYAAATAPVNPPGTTTVLSLSQLYAGLERKTRYVSTLLLASQFPMPPSKAKQSTNPKQSTAPNTTISRQQGKIQLTTPSEPQLFLAVIDTCVVVSDDGDTVVRDVKFKDGRYELSFQSSTPSQPI